MKKKFSIAFISTVVLIWAVDLLSKFWALDALKNNHSIDFIGTTASSLYLRFSLVFNRGGIFGILQGHTIIFQLLTAAAIVFLIIYYYKAEEEKKTFVFAIAFILGGAFGNFTDRIIDINRGVVDFIEMGVNLGEPLGRVEVLNPGQGYTEPPTVKFVSETGEGARAVAEINEGKVSAIKLLEAGNGYHSIPRVVIESAKGSGATAMATLSAIPQRPWPTYNVADAFISIGFILLLISFIQAEIEMRRKSKEAVEEDMQQL